MAKVIIENQNVVKISTDSDISNYYTSDLRTIMDLSDSDFESVRLNTKSIALVDGVLELTDTPNGFADAKNLDQDISSLIKTITIFLDENINNPMYSSLKSYKDFLDSFDTSSITYPYNKSWEQYCNENSITFFHPLQIP